MFLIVHIFLYPFWTVLISGKCMFHHLTDCYSMEASNQENGDVEVFPFSCSFVRCWYGDAHLHPNCTVFLVPLHFNISNPAYVQPSVQSRAGDISHPCWKQSEHWFIISHIPLILYREE